MGLFSKNEKKKKNIAVVFDYVDGINNLFVPRDGVTLQIDENNENLIITGTTKKNKTASLPLSKIKDVRNVKDAEIEQMNKSVVGRAAVGTLLLGPLGAILGGMSGVGTKTKNRHFLFITYFSNDEEKQLVFEITKYSWYWEKLIEALPQDPNSPFASSKAAGHVDL